MPRSKRPRLRRVLKWAGLVGCVLIVVAWGWSLDYTIEYTRRTFLLSVSHGQAHMCVHHTNTSPEEYDRLGLPLGWFADPIPQLPEGWRYPHPRGLCWPSTDQFSHSAINRTARAYNLPLWIPFVVAVATTGILFLRDRRHYPPGHCPKCGYDLTGNESGVCSECGTGVGAPPLDPRNKEQKVKHGLGGSVRLPRCQGMGRAFKHRDDRTALSEGPRGRVRAGRLNRNDA